MGFCVSYVALVIESLIGGCFSERLKYRYKSLNPLTRLSLQLLDKKNENQVEVIAKSALLYSFPRPQIRIMSHAMTYGK